MLGVGDEDDRLEFTLIGRVREKRMRLIAGVPHELRQGGVVEVEPVRGGDFLKEYGLSLFS